MEYVEYFRKFPDAYAKVVAHFDRPNTLTKFLRDSGVLDGAQSVLSIGPGDGAVEARLLQESNLRLGFVEPSQSFFAQCRENLLRVVEESRIIEAENVAFQNYQAAEPYDTVLSLFSWFAMGYDRAILEKALACVKPRGKLLICIQAETSPSTVISRASRSDGIGLTSEALSAWATSEGFAHRYTVYHGLVPKEIYLDKNRLTEAGRDLVSFVSATPWDSIPESLKQNALDAMLAACDGTHVDLSGGCLIFET